MEPMVRSAQLGSWNRRNCLLNRQGTVCKRLESKSVPQPETSESSFRLNQNGISPTRTVAIASAIGTSSYCMLNLSKRWSIWFASWITFSLHNFRIKFSLGYFWVLSFRVWVEFSSIERVTDFIKYMFFY